MLIKLSFSNKCKDSENDHRLIGILNFLKIPKFTYIFKNVYKIIFSTLMKCQNYLSLFNLNYLITDSAYYFHP